MAEQRTPAGESARASDEGDPIADARAARERLRAAQNERERVRERIDAEGEAAVETAAEAYRNAHSLLDHYDDKAIGSGRATFQAYVNLETKFVSLVDSLPEDLEARDAFEAAWDALNKSRLAERDFERARTALEPAERYPELLDAREEAAAEYRAARTAANRQREALKSEKARLERLLELASVDLDAPVERLREPIEAYNEAIRAAFEEFLQTASAREVFAFLERAEWQFLVPFESPPQDLQGYVEENPAGEHTISELLEYAEYSRSKLAHHVDDADALKRQVATQRTYLVRLDGEPLTVEWPPPEPVTLRYQLRDRRPLAERVGGQEAVDRLRTIRDLTHDPEYDRLQTAAVAAERLSPDERETLSDGRIEDELAAVREERDRLDAALEEAAEEAG